MYNWKKLMLWSESWKQNVFLSVAFMSSTLCCVYTRLSILNEGLDMIFYFEKIVSEWKYENMKFISLLESCNDVFGRKFLNKQVLFKWKHEI